MIGRDSSVLPKPIEYKFEDQRIKPQSEFKKPYDDIKIPDYSTPKRAPVDSFSQNITGSRVSKTEQIQETAFQQTRSQDNNFDWKATNADRFVNSPCYKILGFDPKKDPVEQEKEYNECEAEYRNKNLVNILIGLLIVGGFFVLIYFALKEVNPKLLKH
jgi:hypothetical protein